MDIFLAYIFTFFIIFVLMPVVYYLLRFILWLILDFCGCGKSYQEERHDQQSRRITFGHIYDRQGNIFTIANETTSNPSQHRCTDFFYVDPSAEDAARIRSQLEKDEKDLPTYEEVMAMSAAQAAARSLAPYTASNTSIATTDTTVPPYTEVDRTMARTAQPPATAQPPTNAILSVIALQPLNSGDATAWTTGNTSIQAGTGTASTSRAAAAAATATPSTVVTIANSLSNTSV